MKGSKDAERIRVGIIGANPDRGWAAQAHIPALKSLSEDFEITAVSTSRRESADAAGKLFGVPLAFDKCSFGEFRQQMPHFDHSIRAA
jgi:predicted dehydrogenase